jgi:RHH-type rel operon transcriptional repressor/antitoxin RelB
VETKRPRSYHIQTAIEAYVREFADLQVALDRLRDQSDPVVSARDLRGPLGL